jgi:hypothetical protein
LKELFRPPVFPIDEGDAVGGCGEPREVRAPVLRVLRAGDCSRGGILRKELAGDPPCKLDAAEPGLRGGTRADSGASSSEVGSSVSLSDDATLWGLAFAAALNELGF